METKGRGKPGMAQWIHKKKKDGGKVQEMGSESWKTACFWFTRIGPKAGPECSGATPSFLPPPPTMRYLANQDHLPL